MTLRPYAHVRAIRAGMEEVSSSVIATIAATPGGTARTPDAAERERIRRLKRRLKYLPPKARAKRWRQRKPVKR
jgi:hypothetical protein